MEQRQARRIPNAQNLQDRVAASSMIFGGWQKFSMIDFPGRPSAILFTQGCPFRCPFCHNPELLNAAQGMFAPITEEEILEFLQTRRGKLDGVVITGGEPTLHNDLIDFIRRLKEMEFAVKLDTNGSHPEMLERIIRNDLLDYIAMDYKAPLEKYQTHTNSQILSEHIRESARMIKESGVDYEFRTTVVREQLSPEDIMQIGQEIQGAKKYILQKFLPDKTLNPDYANMTTYEDHEFEQFCLHLKPFVAQCLWR
jgi:pyruvate formate lyase activating enzyme